MQLDDKTKFFKDLSPFASLTRSDLDDIISKSNEKKLNKDEFLFLEGDDPKGLFFVKQGHVMILKQAASGKNLIVKVVTPGEFCGEAGVFNNIPYIASAQALVDTVVYMISRKHILSLIKAHPEVVFELIGMSARKIMEAFSMIYGLGNRDLEQRIAFTLLKLVEIIGEKKAGYIELNIPISRQRLAEMVSSTAESVSRIMAELKREGVLKSVNKKIVILDYEKLKCIPEEIEG